jgi:hypothetical protein
VWSNKEPDETVSFERCWKRKIRMKDIVRNEVLHRDKDERNNIQIEEKEG